MSLLLLLILGLIFRESHCSFQILEQESTLITKTTEAEFELRCSANQEWQYCRWSHNNNDCSRTRAITPDNCAIHDEVQWRNVEDTNACVMRVSRPIRERDEGDWRCLLVAKSNATVTATFVYTVDVLEPSSVAFGTKPRHTMKEGTEYSVDCIAHGGNPTPVLSALVGPDPFLSELDEQLEVIKTSVENQDISTLFKLRPDTKHEQSYIKCVASQPHPADPSILAFEPSVQSEIFEVVFAPIALYSSLSFMFDPNLSTEIAIDIRARPMPNNERIVWHVVHYDSTLSQKIPVGSIKGRYTALPLQLRGSEAIARLIIDPTEEEDEDLYWYLEVTNDVGRTEMPFQLVIRPNEPPPKSNIVTDDVNSATMTIILVIVAIIFLVVLTALLFLFFLRRNDQCCFQMFGTRRRKLNSATYVDVARMDAHNNDLYVRRQDNN